jgi:hypothetical protein
MHVTPGYDSSIQIFPKTGQARKGTVNTDARLGTSDARHFESEREKFTGDGRARFICCIGRAILGQATFHAQAFEKLDCDPLSGPLCV